MYCVSVWGSTYQSNLKRIFLLQKKLVRIISKASFDAHTGPPFKDLQILKFHDIYQNHTRKLIFLFTKDLLSNYFKPMFMFITSQVHSYNTGTSKLFYMFPSRTNLRQFSIRFQGPKFFNSLSNNIKDCEGISLFSKNLKELLLSL